MNSIAQFKCVIQSAYFKVGHLDCPFSFDNDLILIGLSISRQLYGLKVDTSLLTRQQCVIASHLHIRQFQVARASKEFDLIVLITLRFEALFCLESCRQSGHMNICDEFLSVEMNSAGIELIKDKGKD